MSVSVVLHRQLGQHGAGRGDELETMAAESEGVEEAVMAAAAADHGAPIRRIAIDPGPDPDHGGVPEMRHDLDRHGCRLARRLGPRAGHQTILGDAALAAAEEHIAAGDLAQIEIAAD